MKASLILSVVARVMFDGVSTDFVCDFHATSLPRREQEYEAQARRAPSGRGRGRPPSATKTASTASGLGGSGKRKAREMAVQSLSSPSPAPAVGNTTKSGSAAKVVGWDVPRKSSASPGRTSRGWGSSSASSGAGCGSGSGSTASGAKNHPWPGSDRSGDRSDGKRAGEKSRQQQEHKRKPPPPYPDMVVEALYKLSDSRGSSQLATVKWLKASQYGWMATPDEAKFKARVSAGIKQVCSYGWREWGYV